MVPNGAVTLLGFEGGLLEPLPGLAGVPPGELELELVRAIVPTTLKVTVKPSLFGLLNFRLRTLETSFGVSVLSEPIEVP